MYYLVAAIPPRVLLRDSSNAALLRDLGTQKAFYNLNDQDAYYVPMYANSQLFTEPKIHFNTVVYAMFWSFNSEIPGRDHTW